jgi:hypothetical protein
LFNVIGEMIAGGFLHPATGEGWDGGDVRHEEVPIPLFNVNGEMIAG